MALEEQGGRPQIAPELQRLIRRMASDSPLSGDERIANQSLVKLGLRVAADGEEIHAADATRPAARRSALGDVLEESRQSDRACDFFVAFAATFRMLYVFVDMEHGTRRLVHVNVTTHPTANWTLRQLREVVADTDGYRSGH